MTFVFKAIEIKGKKNITHYGQQVYNTQIQRTVMNRLTIIFSILLPMLLIVSCGNNKTTTTTSTQEQEQIVYTETPIKTEILGLGLTDVSNEKAVEKALSKATEKKVFTQSYKVENLTFIRSFPYSSLVTPVKIYYGTLPWRFVDVILNKDHKIESIMLEENYDNMQSAKEQYDDACLVLSQKYGPGNVGENYTYWTDKTNTVLVKYYNSTAENGSEGYFCVMTYLNESLKDEAKIEVPDV